MTTDRTDKAGQPVAWQVIETAPKNELIILLLVPTLRKRSLPIAGTWFNGFWIIFNADEAIQRVEPTHWMPCPGEPSATPPDSLAVAQAMEQAAKVCDKHNHTNIYGEEHALAAHMIEVEVRALSAPDLAAEARRTVEDAERYRWLNAKDNFLVVIDDKPVRLKCGEPLDKWIDAARKQAT